MDAKTRCRECSPTRCGPHVVRQAVILTGGVGSRLKKELNDLPKPMVDVDGAPLLEQLVKLCIESDLTDIVFLSGYRAEKIEAYFGNGSKFGVHISHLIEDTPLGTGGALRGAFSILARTFVLIYGDVYMDVEIRKVLDHHYQSESAATIVVHPNTHPQDSDIIETGDQGYVKRILSRPHPVQRITKNCVSAGLIVLNKRELMKVTPLAGEDFGSVILPRLVDTFRVSVYSTCEYMRDIGTPKRLSQVREELKRGVPRARRFSTPKSAIFFDRDGTLIRFVPNLVSNTEVTLVDQAPEAIALVNQSKSLAIVVTNQPQVARGLMSLDELELVHNKIEWELGLKGAYLDGIYYCPHYNNVPDETRVSELDYSCDCRKPRSGLFLSAHDKFNIDFTKSWMIGDSARDIESAKRMGMRSIRIQNSFSQASQETASGQDFVKNALLDAVKTCLSLVK